LFKALDVVGEERTFTRRFRLRAVVLDGRVWHMAPAG
jgi:hypothetical protein